MPNSSPSSIPVWLFYPNLIGYARIVLALLSMWWFPSSPGKAMLSYSVSAALDAFDGWAARTFNQSSRLGAMLDQLTDRCALLSLVMTLCVLYPSYQFFFQFSAVLDMSSHWLHLHATDLSGKNTHKQSSNAILNLYYTSRPFLGFMCAGNEAFYLLMYIAAFFPGPSLFSISLMGFLSFLAFPIALLKSAISVVHLCTAAVDVVEMDERARALKSQ
ncbi:hypothetical protein PFISCL1PPCAC_15536 [Pristionchus fissidentatus]|uniref:CDP-diacylglycerol--inositol 3-phosphatidyltransferase n=1 Tax=Pristionchus fissidentatus TaxID=1538716 RepID=A0AAV5W0L6_9BILA|nr:hypothetical protein PFISCL1PPCAC_15536 [Pristionchus fissidentatus]